jgi:hypothetical protein
VRSIAWRGRLPTSRIDRAITIDQSSDWRHTVTEYKAEPPGRTSALGLARYAYEYIDAANVVYERDQERHPGNEIAPIPAYWLASHGVELALKSFLLHRGVSQDELSSRKLGHDLFACRKRAEELGLLERFKPHDRDEAAMELLAGLNADHSLRYIKTGLKHFPLWSLVYPLAVRLHQAVAPLVGYETFTVSFSEYE